MTFTDRGFSRDIDSWEKMLERIREVGIIPFFSCSVPGWSIQEMTAPGCWFDENGADGVLGPWDWKVDVVRDGSIAYGKFLGGKAAFASVECYGHLMNWRRSIPRFGMADGKRFKATTASERFLKEKSPLALSAIRENGSCGSRELRAACGGIRKAEMERVMQFLQMGTWSVVGDIQRVYNGPDLSYKGWQISSNTTPEALFGTPAARDAVQPSWAHRFETEAKGSPLEPGCSPEESRNILIDRVLQFFPGTDTKVLQKLI